MQVNDIVPSEPSFEKLSALPSQPVFGDDLSPDRLADNDLLDTLYEQQDDPDPAMAQAAQQILRAIGRKSVQREMGDQWRCESSATVSQLQNPLLGNCPGLKWKSVRASFSTRAPEPP